MKHVKQQPATDKMSFHEACNRYPHRFTLEHVPNWARKPNPDGMYYAPQYVSDSEWYDNTVFPPQNPFHRSACYSTGQTWPLGLALENPFCK